MEKHNTYSQKLFILVKREREMSKQDKYNLRGPIDVSAQTFPKKMHIVRKGKTGIPTIICVNIKGSVGHIIHMLPNFSSGLLSFSLQYTSSNAQYSKQPLISNTHSLSPLYRHIHISQI